MKDFNTATEWKNLSEKEQENLQQEVFSFWRDKAIDFCTSHAKEIWKNYRNSCFLGNPYLCLDWATEENTATASIATVENNLIPFWTQVNDGEVPKGESKQALIQSCLKLYGHVRDCPSDKIPVWMTYQVAASQNNETNDKDKFPFGGILFYIDKSVGEEADQRQAKRENKQNNQKPKEIDIEDSFYDWLRLNDVDAERQVKTSCGHRIDIWIPGKAIIELKKKTVTANDVCQCIDYASEYSIPIILSGERISTAASRGIKGFSKVLPDAITYIPLSSLRVYLTGLLSLKHANY